MDSIIARGAFMQGLLISHMQDFRYEHFERDILSLKERVRQEGVSFMTKTLPLIGKAVISALCSGRFSCPKQFRTHRNSVLPVFLYGAISKVFFDDGRVKDPSPSHIFMIRQLTLVFYKLKVEPTEEDVAAALSSFIARDQSIRPIARNEILTTARSIVTKLFSSFSFDFNQFRFGPGATSDKKSIVDRWSFQTFYQQLDRVLPYEFVFPYTPRESFKWYGENRVLFVPKDSRGPRTISCEPPEYMYYQQFVGRSIMGHLQRFPYINFLDQTINQRLAMEGSISQQFNTVDFKDASDLISLELVQDLFQETQLCDVLSALRTPVSLLPSGQRIFLKKYAAMGSALCFPVESVVFYALSAAYAKCSGMKASFYVYGDDIVTDMNDLQSYSSEMRNFNLIVNLDKSFFSGPFRESCGGDYVNGIEVNYIKCNSLEPSSLIPLANRLYDSGLTGSAYFIAEHVRAPMGYSAIDCYAFGVRSGTTRFSRYHTLEVRTRSTTARSARLSDSAAYFRWHAETKGSHQSSYVVGLRNPRRKFKFVTAFN